MSVGIALWTTHICNYITFILKDLGTFIYKAVKGMWYVCAWKDEDSKSFWVNYAIIHDFVQYTCY